MNTTGQNAGQNAGQNGAGRGRKKAGLWTATSVAFCSMVGTGVFTSLGFQLEGLTQPFSILLLWTIGGVLSLCGALCYAELASRLPGAGGEYHYLGRVYHPALGFIAGWVSVVAGFAAPIAISCVAFGSYLSAALPSDFLAAYHFTPQGIAIATAVLVSGVQCLGLRAVIWQQDLATYLKIALIGGFALAALFAPGKASLVSFAPQPGIGAELISGSFAVSLIFVMYSYSGWNGVIYIYNDVARPTWTVPRALLLATASVMLLYVGLHVLYLWSTSAELLRGQVEVARIVGEQLLGERGGRLASLTVAGGLIASVSAWAWAGPRVMQRMWRDLTLARSVPLPAHNAEMHGTEMHGAPSAAEAELDASDLPVAGVLLLLGMVLVMLTTSTFESILVYAQFTLQLISALAAAAVMVLRHREKTADARLAPAAAEALAAGAGGIVHRPFRMPLYPLPVVIYCGISAATLIWVCKEKPVESVLGLCTASLGLLLYAGQRWGAKAGR